MSKKLNESMSLFLQRTHFLTDRIKNMILWFCEQCMITHMLGDTGRFNIYSQPNIFEMLNEGLSETWWFSWTETCEILLAFM